MVLAVGAYVHTFQADTAFAPNVSNWTKRRSMLRYRRPLRAVLHEMGALERTAISAMSRTASGGHLLQRTAAGHAINPRETGIRRQPCAQKRLQSFASFMPSRCR